jgi:2-polyprenyl-3-methyl-5-hydroxy-6-metoxy-1,4-benzoquinol methylase
MQLLSPRFARTGDAPPAMPLSSKQRQYLEQVRRKLSSGEFKRMKVACPCRTAALNNDVCIAQIDRYGLALDSLLCRDCGTVRIDPYLDETSLSDFYAHYYQDLYARNSNLPHLFSYQRMHYGQRIAEFYQSYLTNDSAVLEIGCGTGSALLAFADRGCFVAGCDFSDELVKYGTDQGVKNLWTGTLDDAPPPAARHYDLIYLFHVLEHVSEPAALLSQLRSKLTPEGRILSAVPDLFRIDRHRNPAGDALKFLHIAHSFNYSVAGLASIAQQAHLSASRVSPPPREYGPDEDARDLSEMWMEFAPASEINRVPAASAGDENLRYLLATEELFQAGQCPAQLTMASRETTPAPAAPQPMASAPQRQTRWYQRLPIVRSVRKALGLGKKRAA